jgi:hypothetical protein
MKETFVFGLSANDSVFKCYVFAGISLETAFLVEKVVKNAST